MKWLPRFSTEVVVPFSIVLFLLFIVAGCEQANVTLDRLFERPLPLMAAASPNSDEQIILVKRRPVEERSVLEESAQSTQTKQPTTPVQTLGQTAQGKKRSPGESLVPDTAPTSEVKPAPAPTRPVPAPGIAQGKRRPPGEMIPSERPPLGPSEEEQRRAREPFFVTRDPFKEPTEILPSECPPSMPLCRFDRSQLKLVGVIQISEGQFKGMVEDPDGRGYFITPGMQIGGATVTQITNKGVTLHVHRSRTDVIMPLAREARETGEF